MAYNVQWIMFPLGHPFQMLIRSVKNEKTISLEGGPQSGAHLKAREEPIPWMIIPDSNGVCRYA
jgi:hypothetical protein